VTRSVAQLRGQGTRQHRLRQAQRQLAITHGSYLLVQQRINEPRARLGGVRVADPEAGIANPPPPPYTPPTPLFTAEGLWKQYCSCVRREQSRSSGPSPLGSTDFSRVSHLF
jgi:hypothetical protein